MRAADLIAEWQRAFEQLEESDRKLLPGSLSPTALSLAGITRVDLDLRSRLYQPDPQGRPALILAVRVDDPRSPETRCWRDAPITGDLVDLVALIPGDPSTWALRCGAASWLGAIPPQYSGADPVRLHRTPADWLRAGADGLCVLTRSRREAHRFLALLIHPVVADADHAKRLRDILQYPYSIPRITIARPA